MPNQNLKESTRLSELLLQCIYVTEETEYAGRNFHQKLKLMADACFCLGQRTIAKEKRQRLKQAVE